MADLTITPAKVAPLAGSIVVAKEAGEDMTVGNLVYVSSDGTVKLCDADTLATVTGQMGIVVAGNGNGGLPSSTGAIVDGETVSVVVFGRVSFGEAILDETKQYYASNTAGAIGDVTGTITRRVGAPESDTIFFFNPNTVAPTS